jgi:hypothetical protein
MKFINDWMVLGLVIGLACGGLVAGRKMGSLAACWLAASAWLGFRLADRLWKVTVMELRADDPQLDLVFWIPITYGFLFVCMLLPAVVGLVWLRPKKSFTLPGSGEDWAGALGGLALMFILFLGLVQSHVMHPLGPERIPNTLDAVRPLLSGLGQAHYAPNTQPGATIKPEAEPKSTAPTSNKR